MDIIAATFVCRVSLSIEDFLVFLQIELLLGLQFTVTDDGLVLMTVEAVIRTWVGLLLYHGRGVLTLMMA